MKTEIPFEGYAKLSMGATHYRIAGPADGRWIVLVHGIAGPKEIWSSMAEILTGAGFRILTYDLVGRGRSDRPRTRYNLGLFQSQLEELLTYLEITQQINLVGWSLGAMVSAAFAVSNPEKIARLALVSPAGVEVSLPFTAKMALAPGLGDLLVGLFGKVMVLRSIAAGLYDQSLRDDLIGLLEDQLAAPGYLRAFLSTLRHCGGDQGIRYYQALGSTDFPALLITGSDDPSIPRSVSRKLTGWITALKWHEIDQCGHLPLYEKPAETGQKLLDFLA